MSRPPRKWAFLGPNLCNGGNVKLANFYSPQRRPLILLGQHWAHRQVGCFGFGLLCAVLISSLSAQVTVRVDGSGDFSSLQAALDAAPKGGRTVYEIRLGAGAYSENVLCNRDVGPIRIVGEGTDRTVIRMPTVVARPSLPSSKGAPMPHQNAKREAGVRLRSSDVLIEGMTFRNDQPQSRAVPVLEVSGERMVFVRCAFFGKEETLRLQAGSAWFDTCLVVGQKDVINGAGVAWFENCEIRGLGEGVLAAPATSPSKKFGFVFSSCRFSPEHADWKMFLGRPASDTAAMMVLKSHLPATIHPFGWQTAQTKSGQSNQQTTLRFAEGGNVGAGAKRDPQADTSRVMRPEEIQSLGPLLVLGWHRDSGLLPHRLAALPAAERSAWLAYLQRSEQLRAADATVLAAERKAARVKKALQAPVGKDFKRPHRMGRDWLAGPDGRRLAMVILSFQAPNGGWAKNVSYAEGERQPGMFWSSAATLHEPWHYTATFDNHATTEQLQFLMEYWEATRDAMAKKAFLRGMEFIFQARYPNGGWPQVFPLVGGYHDNITLNDDALAHILRTLQLVAAQNPSAGLVDRDLIRRCDQAFSDGIDLLLRLQVRQNGVLSVWCAQYDPLSLAPAAARLKEPVALSGGESVAALELLLNAKNPPPKMAQAITAAIAWFEKSAITGLRVTKRHGRTWYEAAPGNTKRFWARFYGIEDNQPIFAGAKDGIQYADFATMQASNPSEYAFFTDKPERVLMKAAKERKK